jgi:hypothetical protein
MCEWTSKISPPLFFMPDIWESFHCAVSGHEKLEKNGRGEQRWVGGPPNSIYVRAPFVSETGINFFKRPSEIKLNLHVLLLERKQKKRSQKFRNDCIIKLVANRLHEIANEI